MLIMKHSHTPPTPAIILLLSAESFIDIQPLNDSAAVAGFYWPRLPLALMGTQHPHTQANF